MFRLALLLIGARSVRRRWAVLPVLGLLWMGLGALLVADVSSDGELAVAIEVVSALLVLEGLGALGGALAAGGAVRSGAWRGLALVVLGVLLLRPFDHGLPESLLFGAAFLFDGALRVASAWVVRFAGWRWALAAGLLELLLAGLVLASWPVPHTLIAPFCLGVALLASGWNLIRLGLALRGLPPGASLTMLPLYTPRQWRGLGALPHHEPRFDAAEPMVLHVWTPVGSSHDARRMLLVDRYIAAVDGKGRISTGHSALEVRPDVYISHYPAVEIDRAPQEFSRILRATADNDLPGRFLPSHAHEVEDWCEPDARVVFPRYDAVALRAFWEVYRRDATYNLTSRSCSTATSLAIDSALEGVLGGGRFPFLRALGMLADPQLWLASLLRRRGATMAWTPGLVLDYARALESIVEGREGPWVVRLWRTLRRADRTRPARPA